MQTIAITPTERQPVPRLVGTQYVSSNYRGAFDDRRPGAHAFLVEQRSPKLGAHLHEVDQFHVVLEGAGTLGRDRMVRDVPHYSDAYTSCRPICTVTPDDLTYLTLRSDATIGANVMPESRELRDAHGSGGEHFTVCLTGDSATRPGLTGLSRTSRGAVAYVARLAAAERLTLPEATSASDGYAVVIDGALDLRGTTYPPGSLACFGSLTNLTDARAGADGLTLAVLIFAPAA
jgi:hypothetical protein